MAEKVFHNQLEHDRVEHDHDHFLNMYPNKRFYVIARSGEQALNAWIESRCKGKRVLDYCCGPGQLSIKLAEHGAYVLAMDISDEGVKSAANNVRAAGMKGSIKLLVMDGERLAFQDRLFDCIVCCGVLHHLELETAYRELSRVLKPDGEIFCVEPLGHNPLINLYRRLTPSLRTPWEINHVLKIRDLRIAQRYFEGVTVRYCYLISILGFLFRKTRIFGVVLRLLEGIDGWILSIPGIRLLAWQVILCLAKPKQSC